MEGRVVCAEDGLVLQVAERGPDVYDGIELFLKRDLPHITVDPLDLNDLGLQATWHPTFHTDPTCPQQGRPTGYPVAGFVFS